MEHARNVRVLEVPYRWNDVGDWRAVATLLEHDAAGNAIQGNVVARDTTGSIIISDDGGLVADAGRRRPGRRPLGQGHAGRPERPARQAQGPGRRIGRGGVRVVSVTADRAETPKTRVGPDAVKDRPDS